VRSSGDIHDKFCQGEENNWGQSPYSFQPRLAPLDFTPSPHAVDLFEVVNLLLPVTAPEIAVGKQPPAVVPFHPFATMKFSHRPPTSVRRPGALRLLMTALRIAALMLKIGCLIDTIRYNTVSMETEMEEICTSARNSLTISANFSVLEK